MWSQCGHDASHVEDEDLMKDMRAAAITAVMVVAVAGAARAQTAEDRAAARDIVARRGGAIITVMGTLKARMSKGGRDNPAPDQAVRASATILDPSGLTVVALSAIDPGNIIAKSPNFAAAKMTIATELVDVKMRLGDGTEVPAKIVLRDSDLDLLFIKPASPPATPMPSVEGTSATMKALDSVVVVQRFGESAGWQAAATFGTIEAVVEKPRALYLVAMTTTGSGIGATIFDIHGQFAGVVTLRSTTDSSNNALTGMKGDALQTLGMMPVVVTAADIRGVAKQASEK
jgi:S1-C subfamily serine protease